VRSLGGEFGLYPNHARILYACTGLGFQPLPCLIWRKQTNAPNKFMGSGMLPAGGYVTLEHEYILVLRKGGRRRFDTDEARLCRRRSAFFWEERNRWFSDIWDFKGARQELAGGESRERSAAFPFELPFRLIAMYSCIGDTVLDPFLGTGTTACAAIMTGRNSLGVELAPELIAKMMQAIPRQAEFFREAVRRRVEDHLSFVRLRTDEKGPLKHTNRPHGFPVVTSQETDLTLYEPASLGPAGDNVLEAAHCKVEGFQLSFL
jgi:DNA modification methylase